MDNTTGLDNIVLDKLVLAVPNGFCAGVDMAERSAHLTIDVMEEMKMLGMLDKDARLYLKHQIVHNNAVVNKLLDRDAIVIEDMNDVPDGSFIFFSAHGSSKDDYKIAQDKNLKIVDGTCGLVTKVHKAMMNYSNKGRDIVYIGNKNHVEAKGAVGQIPGKDIPIVYTVKDAESLDVSHMNDPVFVTQTTLSVDDTKAIADILKSKGVSEPSSDTICYATTNRQEAVKKLKDHGCNIVIIIGSQQSSNANKLVKTSENAGMDAYLADGLEDIEYSWFSGKSALGLSSAASTPQESLDKAVNYFKARSRTFEIESYTSEDVKFNIPRSLVDIICSNLVLKERFYSYL
jgi:4-hydroxy-3-methylbut-2-en-1-yl diphosphate reductase